MFESLIVEHIITDLEKIIILEQHGFCSGKSVTTNMDNRKQVDVLYTDFTNAFDLVNYYKLINKLSKCGIHGSLLRWIESYICNRSQIVVLGDDCSKEIDITFGIPQGPSLLQVVFLNSKCLLYPDDLIFLDR